MRNLRGRMKGEGHEIPKGQEEWQGRGEGRGTWDTYGAKGRAKDIRHLRGKRNDRHLRCLRGRSKGEGMRHLRDRKRAREMRPPRGRGKSEGREMKMHGAGGRARDM
jgi:hypothetical protein